MKLQRKQVSVANAVVRLQTMCSRSEHCEFELREKLRMWCVPQADAETILADLHAERFYDDSRFAAAYVREKMLFNRWGRRKIMLGLRAKRVDTSIIRNVLADVDEDEYTGVLLGFMKAKARSISEGNTYEGRTKLYRAAMARGYESDLIARILRSGMAWNNDNAD
jgi:regulatory protein